MADFPTIDALPLVDDWEESIAIDPTLRSSQEGGYVITRARFTRLTYKYHVAYYPVPDDDKETIKDFEATVLVGSESFNYTLPDASIIIVRFSGPITYRRGELEDLWRIEFDLEEV